MFKKRKNRTMRSDRVSISLSNNPRFWEIIDRSRQQQKEGQVKSSDEVRKMLGLE